MTQPGSPADRRGEAPRPQLVVLSWRDRRHPDAGGSETYVETVCQGLVERGWDVTLVAAAHDNGAPEEVVHGVRILRRGSRWTVYPRGLAALRWLRPDIVLEVQNGVPFLARLATRAPVVVLVHHVHREQWKVVLPTPLAQIGWFLESRVAPAVNRALPYVAVSHSTRDELAGLGVAPERVTVLHNGSPPEPAARTARTPWPQLVVVSRLVPQKRVGLALDAMPALVSAHPEVRLVVVGEGYWREELVTHAERLGIGDRVRFTGWVPDEIRDRLLGESWVHLMPSLKEGWGLAVVEAGVQGTPTVAFAGTGGLEESVLDGHTGYLVDSMDDWIRRIGGLVADAAERDRLGKAARKYAASFNWSETVAGFDVLLRRVLERRPVRPARS